MKKVFLIGAISGTGLFLASVNVNAQQIIIAQNGNAVSIYNSLDSAILNANNGDTLYLSGGSFSLNTPISKRLYIYGVGHNPDSSAVTNPTYIIDQSVYFQTGAGGGLISGVYLQLGFQFEGTINNFTVSRCNLGHIQFTSNAHSNNIFYENIIRGPIYLGTGLPPHAQSNAFYNNIIGSFLYTIGPNNSFKNNIFLNDNGANGGQGTVISSSFENNIFIATSNSTAHFSNSILINNLFVENLAFPNGTNTGSNNIVNQTQASIFVNQTGNLFSYTQNYHLNPSSPGVNAGIDGKDIGIYGGLFPWKEGSLPNNPHIQFKNISGSTDQNGNLQINIKVKAQDN